MNYVPCLPLSVIRRITSPVYSCLSYDELRPLFYPCLSYDELRPLFTLVCHTMNYVPCLPLSVIRRITSPVYLCLSYDELHPLFTLVCHTTNYIPCLPLWYFKTFLDFLQHWIFDLLLQRS